jgi:Zn-dependent peptidase ImmA (M78 family)
MAIEVRYLSLDSIEKEAELLLAEYVETTSTPIQLPVPVEEITRYHLALQLGYADLHETLDIPRLRNEPEVLGAMFVEQELVLIDHSLDPQQDPSMAGRYRFSVAHEIGHWRLHRSYVTQDAKQTSLFGDSSRPTVICRSSEAHAPIEYQANFYAACLLMPRRAVLNIWEARFQSLQPLIYSRLRNVMRLDPPRYGNRPRRLGEALSEQGYENFADRWAEYFAPMFGVSRQSMRIRLEQLDLLRRSDSRQLEMGETSHFF